jgi:putative endonuclease
VIEHKTGEGSDFTKKYNLHDLVYFERISDIVSAIKREKQIKKWHREWKLNLIKEMNPSLEDLSGKDRLTT